MHDGKISIHELGPGKTIAVKGDEPWLGRLYKDFPADEPPAPRLTGELKLVPSEIGTVRVTGDLAYAPFVPCSRCGASLAWPLAIEVDATFQPEDVNPAPKEKNLSPADLDAYYLEGDDVDLEQLVTDLVVTSMPSQTPCAACANSGTAPVYEDDAGQADKPNPFAALKGLKLPN